MLQWGRVVEESKDVFAWSKHTHPHAQTHSIIQIRPVLYCVRLDYQLQVWIRCCIHRKYYVLTDRTLFILNRVRLRMSCTESTTATVKYLSRSKCTIITNLERSPPWYLGRGTNCLEVHFFSPSKLMPQLDSSASHSLPLNLYLQPLISLWSG